MGCHVTLPNLLDKQNPTLHPISLMTLSPVFDEYWEQLKIPSQKTPGEYYIEKDGFIKLVDLIGQKLGSLPVLENDLKMMEKLGVWVNLDGLKTRFVKEDVEYLIREVKAKNGDFDKSLDSPVLAKLKSPIRDDVQEIVGEASFETSFDANFEADGNPDSKTVFKESVKKAVEKELEKNVDEKEESKENTEKILSNKIPILRPRKPRRKDKPGIPTLMKTPEKSHISLLKTSTPIKKPIETLLEDKEQDIIYRDLQITKLQEKLDENAQKAMEKDRIIAELRKELETMKEMLSQSEDNAQKLQKLTKKLAKEQTGHRQAKNENDELIKQVEMLSKLLRNVENMQTQVNKNELEKANLQKANEKLRGQNELGLLEISSLKLKNIELKEQLEKYKKELLALKSDVGLKLSVHDYKKAIKNRQKHLEQLERLKKMMGSRKQSWPSSWIGLVAGLTISFTVLFLVGLGRFPRAEENSASVVEFKDSELTGWQLKWHKLAHKNEAVSRNDYNVEALDRSAYDVNYRVFLRGLV